MVVAAIRRSIIVCLFLAIAAGSASAGVPPPPDCIGPSGSIVVPVGTPYSDTVTGNDGDGLNLTVEDNGTLPPAGVCQFDIEVPALATTTTSSTTTSSTSTTSSTTTSTLSNCGDGVLDTGEDCDPPNGEICSNLGDDDDDLDAFWIHWRFALKGSMDPSLEGFGVTLSNAGGSIYRATLKPSQIRGVDYVTFRLRAYADFSAATESIMTTGIVVGNDVGSLTTEWTPTRDGWRRSQSDY